jgi:hypothetical protein
VNKKSLLSAFLTALLICGLILVSARFGTVQASTGDSDIPKPSVPEFSLKVVAYPYDVAPTITIDPYTGKNITTSYGYREENKSIEVTIKNQPFTSTLDASGNYTSLYYDVRFKGHYSDDWYYADSAYNASNSDYTVIAISLRQIALVSPGERPISDGDQIDFKVRALIGYKITKAYDSIGLPPELRYYHEFIGQAGDWSNTQTITIGESQTPTLSPSPSPTATSSPATTPTPTPSQEPQQTEQIEPIVGAAIVVAVTVVGVGLLIYLIKRK